MCLFSRQIQKSVSLGIDWRLLQRIGSTTFSWAVIPIHNETPSSRHNTTANKTTKRFLLIPYQYKYPPPPTTDNHDSFYFLSPPFLSISVPCRGWDQCRRSCIFGQERNGRGRCQITLGSFVRKTFVSSLFSVRLSTYTSTRVPLVYFYLIIVIIFYSSLVFTGPFLFFGITTITTYYCYVNF